MASNTLRIVLAAFLFMMYLLAMFYLHRRSLMPRQFLFWGLLALLVPLLGPFLVIASRPGKPLPPPSKPTRPQVNP